MDTAVGRVVAVLERAAMLDNTIILFFSDNGAQVRTYTSWHF